MRAVNLMPRDERRARLDTGRLPLFAAAGGIVAVTAAAFLLASSASSGVDETKAEVQAIEAAIDALPKGETAVSSGTIAQERSNRVAALAAALSSRTAFDRVLRDISLVFPEDVWLTQLEASAPAVATAVPGQTAPPVAAASTSGVTIKGATYSHDSVATVLARLSVLPTLTDVRLTGTSLVQPQASEDADGSTSKPGRAFVTFDVSATLRTGQTP